MTTQDDPRQDQRGERRDEQEVPHDAQRLPARARAVRPLAVIQSRVPIAEPVPNEGQRNPQHDPPDDRDQLPAIQLIEVHRAPA